MRKFFTGIIILLAILVVSMQSKEIVFALDDFVVARKCEHGEVQRNYIFMGAGQGHVESAGTNDANGGHVVDWQVPFYCGLKLCPGIHQSSAPWLAENNGGLFARWDIVTGFAATTWIKSPFGFCRRVALPSPLPTEHLAFSSDDPEISESKAEVTIFQSEEEILSHNLTAEESDLLRGFFLVGNYPENYIPEVTSYVDGDRLIVGANVPHPASIVPLKRVPLSLRSSVEGKSCFTRDENVLPMQKGVGHNEGIGISFFGTDSQRRTRVTVIGWPGIFNYPIAAEPMVSILVEGCDLSEVYVEFTEEVEFNVGVDSDSDDRSRDPVTIQGTTTLQSREFTEGRVSVEVVCPTSGYAASTETADDGSWGFKNVPVGRCDLTATADGYVAAQGLVGVGLRDVFVPPNELLGGDANKDGVVALDDINGIIAHFGQTTVNCEIDGNVFDINCDGVIALDDVTNATLNFAKTSPQLWETVKH